jgi:hypothetical protein
MTNSDVPKNTSVLFSNGQIKAIADFSKPPKNKKTIIPVLKRKVLDAGLSRNAQPFTH